MSARLRHNGCDVLMLGFDHELRRHGFAGNSCQIVLELAAEIDSARLEKRVTELARQHPILRSRPGRGWNLLPRWKPTRHLPRVRVHTPAPELAQQLFNEPLAIRRGELMRFDVLGRTVIFTWAHALMDAKSAEYFLALAGDEKLSAVEPAADWYVLRASQAGGLRARIRQAWPALERLEKFKQALPVSLAMRRPATVPRMKYQIMDFTAEESATVRANASRLCGFLGETNFHLAATLLELDRLHQRTGCVTASHVVPIPVSLRPKGTRAPLFSNQLTMMLHQFLPAQIREITETIKIIKTQRAECLRDGQIDASIALGQLFRALPLKFYMWMVKHELRGEICSLFFGDTSAVDPALGHFLGAPITTFAHVPAITMPPGIGVVFYQFHRQLRFTLVHAEGTLTAAEADDFSRRLRAQLLQP
jgi:hypothetical protein